MDRKDFLKGSVLLTGAALFTKDIFANNLTSNSIDKVVDDKGNFIQPPLPFAENAIEPYMDEETVHLHYAFHHGGAVKGANRDLAMIKEAVDKGDYTYADYWTKKSAHHVSSHILHSIFWTNLVSTKSDPKGELQKRIDLNFGSFDKLKGLIASISKSVEGQRLGHTGLPAF
jgi:superoxide dismutase, Fe-Mn family